MSNVDFLLIWQSVTKTSVRSVVALSGLLSLCSLVTATVVQDHIPHGLELCSPGWLQIYGLPASNSYILGFSICHGLGHFVYRTLLWSINLFWGKNKACATATAWSFSLFLFYACGCFLFVCLWLHVCQCACLAFKEARKWFWIPKTGVTDLWAAMWVLGTELKS